jgi:NAD(P)-dependent dehydrogenase (short-subunit alcohol dehydrogenase family)
MAEKVAIVTGSAGGLGKVISQHLLQAGAHVVLCDISETTLEATYNELKDYGKCISIKLDVSSSSSVQELFEKTIDHFGKIDILINNAGIMDKLDGAADCEESLWNRVLAVNLTGPYLTTKLAVKQFLTQNSSGVILNIGSLGGVLGHRAGVAYTSSKHGLIGLTKNTAVAYATNKIRCNVICPGPMQTNISIAMAGGVNQAGYQILEKVLPSSPGMCDLDQIANLAVFLCGPESSVLNGAVINADLGWSAV